MKYLHDLVRRPIITEKSTLLGEESNKYIFEVSREADKSSIKKAIEFVFGVKVEKVNVINQLGKVKRFKGKIGKRADFKKAVVTLGEGHQIDFTGGFK